MSDQFGMPEVDTRPSHEVITELRQQVTAATDQIAAAVAACKIKDDAFNKLMMLPNKYPGHREIAATGVITEALAVMPSISEWKTRWQKENDGLRQQLATANSELDRVGAELGLPAGIGPAPGELKRILDSLRQQLADSQQALRNVYEVWASRDGLPMPMNAGEYYMLDMIARMRDAAKEGMK